LRDFNFKAILKGMADATPKGSQPADVQSFPDALPETSEEDAAAVLEKHLEGETGPSDEGGSPTGGAKKKWKVNWKAVIKRRPRLPRTGVGLVTQMFVALKGPDAPSRNMAILFFLSLIMVATVFGVSLRRYLQYRQAHPVAAGDSAPDVSQNFGEFIQKQADSAKQRVSQVKLGKFTVSLQPVEGPQAAPGVLSVAEVEIVVLCDNRETRFYIEERIAMAQDQITAVLGTLDREDLLGREGKKRLKKQLMDKLNEWLPNGRVDDLFFSSLLVH